MARQLGNFRKVAPSSTAEMPAKSFKRIVPYDGRLQSHRDHNGGSQSSDVALTVMSGDSAKATITPEAFALNAGVFAANIDSWIPASFGARPTDIERNVELDKILREASSSAEGSNYGIGHVSIGKSASRGGQVGFNALKRRLGRTGVVGDMGKDREPKVDGAMARNGSQQDSDEEEDSRTRALGKGKRKGGVMDFLKSRKASKKSKQGTVSREASPSLDSDGHRARKPDQLLLLDTDRIHGVAEGPEHNEPRSLHTSSAIPHTPPRSPPPGDERFPFSGPLAPESPRAKRELKERERGLPTSQPSASLGDWVKVNGADRGGETSTTVTPVASQDDAETKLQASPERLSKSQRRREAKKRAKLQNAASGR